MVDDLPVTETITLRGLDLEERAARSSGPGGQSVNTSETRVQLRFNLDAAPLPLDVKERLRTACPGRLTRDGWLVLSCDTFRSRLRNRDEVRARLAALVRDAATAPDPRRATRPTRASRTRRLDAKGKRGQTKADRGRVDW